MSDARLEQIILRRAAVAAVLLPVALSTIQGRQVVEKWARNHRPRPLRIVSGSLTAVGTASRGLRRRIRRLVQPGIRAACHRGNGACESLIHLAEPSPSEDPMQKAETPALVVFSGGTAFNSIAAQLRQLTTRVAHVLPVSDDGGSTAEIVRVLGGPAVGDIRSRCLRLADDTGMHVCRRLSVSNNMLQTTGYGRDSLLGAVSSQTHLASYPSPGLTVHCKHVTTPAKDAWALSILRGFSLAAGKRGVTFNLQDQCTGLMGCLIKGLGFGGQFVSSKAKAVKELLGHRLSSTSSTEAKAEWSDIVEGEHRLWAQVSDPYKHTIRAFLVNFHTHVLLQSTEQFSYRNGSIGNYFFAGARLFFRSLEAAIFLFSRVARIPEGSQVLPIICTEERITLGAELLDGSVIRGQHSISHPSSADSHGPSRVDKDSVGPPMAAPIRRMFYLSSDGTGQEHEVFPQANRRVLSEIAEADAILYGIGSLYTSICPSLILAGVAEAIADRSVPKVFLLNGSHDRETSRRAAGAGPMHASDMVLAVCDALNRSRGKHEKMRLDHAPSTYITDLLVPSQSRILVDRDVLASMGIRHIVEVPSTRTSSGWSLYDPLALVDAIQKVVEPTDSEHAPIQRATTASVQLS